MKPKPGSKRLTLDIDEKLHKALKVESAQTDKSIREIVEGLISAHLTKSSRKSS